MNILFIKHFFVESMVSEIPRVSVFGHCPYSVTLYITSTSYVLLISRPSSLRPKITYKLDTT